MKYTNYTNLDSRFARPYEPGDRLVKGWEGDIAVHGNIRGTLEAIFTCHNRDNRPDGQLCPSMSVGDVVVLDIGRGASYSVKDVGFVGVQLDPADLITDRTWREVDY